jgi:hypothetical protein
MVFDSFEGKAALRSGVASSDESSCAGQARVGPHVFAHEVFSSEKLFMRRVLPYREQLDSLVA